MVKNHKERSKFGTEVSVLKSGDKFGDLCFYKSKNERNATVIADENLHLLVVDLFILFIILFKTLFKHVDPVNLSWLQSVSDFAGG